MSGRSGKFAIGQSFTSGEKPSWAKPAIGLMLGGTQSTYEAESKLKLNQWNHLAVVFVPKQGWTTYLNGFNIGTAPDNGFRAMGELSVGRVNEEAKDSQFYGMVDDVAVFETALSARDINRYAAMKALSGTEAGLKWGWRFNAGDEVMNAQSKPPFIEGNAKKVIVSADRNPKDVNSMPAPVQALKYDLPFPYEAEYYVVQGNSGNSHHWGHWAFTWDFIYAGDRSDSQVVRAASGNFQATDILNKRKGPGQPLVSIAAGTVMHANWEVTEGDGNKVPNATIVRHGPGEYSAYYHLRKDSFPAQFPWPSPKQPFSVGESVFAAMDAGAIPDTYPKIAAHKPIGTLGGTGMEACKDCYHLHFGMLDQLDLNSYGKRITRPVHFAEFETSLDRISWKNASGIPEANTYVRRKMAPGGRPARP